MIGILLDEVKWHLEALNVETLHVLRGVPFQELVKWHLEALNVETGLP